MARYTGDDLERKGPRAQLAGDGDYCIPVMGTLTVGVYPGIAAEVLRGSVWKVVGLQDSGGKRAVQLTFQRVE